MRRKQSRRKKYERTTKKTLKSKTKDEVITTGLGHIVRRRKLENSDETKNNIKEGIF